MWIVWKLSFHSRGMDEKLAFWMLRFLLLMPLADFLMLSTIVLF